MCPRPLRGNDDRETNSARPRTQPQQEGPQVSNSMIMMLECKQPPRELAGHDTRAPAASIGVTPAVQATLALRRAISPSLGVLVGGASLGARILSQAYCSHASLGLRAVACTAACSSARVGGALHPSAEALCDAADGRSGLLAGCAVVTSDIRFIQRALCMCDRISAATALALSVAALFRCATEWRANRSSLSASNAKISSVKSL